MDAAEQDRRAKAYTQANKNQKAPEAPKPSLLDMLKPRNVGSTFFADTLRTPTSHNANDPSTQSKPSK